jgi:hypothetical protein
LKDVTSTSFGLLIAFMLPGLTVLFGFAMWSDAGQKLLGTFETAPSSVGLFFLVALAALAIGLLLTPLRALVFEELLARWLPKRLTTWRGLVNEQRLTAFRAATDEFYRYHQFWGSSVFSLPFAVSGYCWRHWDMPFWRVVFSVVAGAVAELTCAWAAYQSLKRYRETRNHILETTEPANA